MGFGLACAPVRCAHLSFWTHWHAQRGAARCSPKINKIYRTLSLAPRPPPHRSFADPSGNIVGYKLCTGTTKGPNFFVFSFFYIIFWAFNFVILFLFFLFFSYRTFLCLLILFFLYFNLFVVLQTYILMIQIYFNFWKITVLGKRLLCIFMLRGISRGQSHFRSTWSQN